MMEPLVQYVSEKCKRSEIIKWMLKNLDEKVFAEPEEPAEPEEYHEPEDSVYVTVTVQDCAWWKGHQKYIFRGVEFVSYWGIGSNCCDVSWLSKQ